MYVKCFSRYSLQGRVRIRWDHELGVLMMALVAWGGGGWRRGEEQEEEGKERMELAHLFCLIMGCHIVVQWDHLCQVPAPWLDFAACRIVSLLFFIITHSQIFYYSNRKWTRTASITHLWNRTEGQDHVSSALTLLPSGAPTCSKGFTNTAEHPGECTGKQVFCRPPSRFHSQKTYWESRRKKSEMNW